MENRFWLDSDTKKENHKKRKKLSRVNLEEFLMSKSGKREENLSVINKRKEL